MACCPPIPPYRYVPPFAGFTEFTASIPKLYFNVKSQEQRIHAMCELINKLICYADMLGDRVNINHDEIEALKKQFQKFIESGFDDYYKEKIFAWIDEHMPELMSRATKQVYFGLNDEGYFVAYVPDSWNDITFDTGAVFGRNDYGRLILRFEADHAIDNTYSYSLAQTRKLDQLIADLEVNAKRTDASFDTLFTNLNEEVVLNGNI